MPTFFVVQDDRFLMYNLLFNICYCLASSLSRIVISHQHYCGEIKWILFYIELYSNADKPSILKKRACSDGNRDMMTFSEFILRIIKMKYDDALYALLLLQHYQNMCTYSLSSFVANNFQASFSSSILSTVQSGE